MSSPPVLILRAPGTNCDEETARAWELAGAAVEVHHVNRLLESPRLLDRFRVVTIPGGFSYGDDLGAGTILAARLTHALGDALTRFVEQGGLILGICNGFQVLVRTGLLPGPSTGVSATLTHNDVGHYVTRWVRLAVGPRPDSPWLTHLQDTILEIPSAHGEGKLVTTDPEGPQRLDQQRLVAFRYVDAQGQPTVAFPDNPNGSPCGIAGLIDPSGRVLGLMPHPERFILPYHHPLWTRRDPAGDHFPTPDGLRFFQAAIQAITSSPTT